MKVRSKVTMGSMQTLEKYDLLSRDEKALTRKCLEISTKPEVINEVGEAIFEQWEDPDWEDFNLAEITRGLEDFLRAYLQPHRG